MGRNRRRNKYKKGRYLYFSDKKLYPECHFTFSANGVDHYLKVIHYKGYNNVYKKHEHLVVKSWAGSHV